MKVIHLGIYHLYISDECWKEDGKLAEKYAKRVSVEEFLVSGALSRLGVSYPNQKSFFDFCRALSGANGDFSVAMLSAHGGKFWGRWAYSDGFFPKSVQKWIDSVDGRHSLLLLHCCNFFQ